MSQSESELDELFNEKLKFESDITTPEDTYFGTAKVLDLAYNMEAKLFIKAMGEDFMNKTNEAAGKINNILDKYYKHDVNHIRSLDKINAIIQQTFNEITDIHNNIIVYGMYTYTFNQYVKSVLTDRDSDIFEFNKLFMNALHEHSSLLSLGLITQLFRTINHLEMLAIDLHGDAYKSNLICDFINNFIEGPTYILIKSIHNNTYAPPPTGNRTKPAKQRVYDD